MLTKKIKRDNLIDIGANENKNLESNSMKLKLYKEMHERSINPEERENFWYEESKEIFWFKEPILDEVLDQSSKPFYRWFPNATTNVCYNCIDRHIKAGKKDSLALIWESAYLKKAIKYTYQEAYEKINFISRILLDNSVKKGDTVIIYMPMIPEGIFSMLACARIGAIHSVVFGGFAAPELADRIYDAKPKIIITASTGIEPRKHVPYFPLVKEALNLTNIKIEEENLNPQNNSKGFDSNLIKILLVQRNDVSVVSQEEIESIKNETIFYNEEISKMSNKDFEEIKVDPVPMYSSEPLYILYTSGTTGSPKGIVRETGGTLVSINFTFKNIMDIESGDVCFSTSDIGWVVGHTFIVYGPLLRGATTMIFEGKPVGTPHCGVIWELIEKYQVKTLYTAPTALRAIKKEDSDCKKLLTYDLKSLKSVHMAGERCDPETNIWLQKALGDSVLINDQWWQTETGWPICCNNIRINRFKTIPGSACRPQMGFDVKILNSENLKEEKGPNNVGMVCIKLPMPPSFMLTLWKNDKAFLEKYISNDENYYISGDCGYFDNEGNIYIMTRMDDMIKIAGHRLTTGRMEEALLKCKEIVEAAVVSIKDELKGELPFAFIVCKNGIKISEKELIEKAKEKIVYEIGAIARLKGVIICDFLPKTRSGKIIRGLLKNLINKEEYTIPSTIEDTSVIQFIEKLIDRFFIDEKN
jgi:propionyl-CoA synthetase